MLRWVCAPLRAIPVAEPKGVEQIEDSDEGPEDGSFEQREGRATSESDRRSTQSLTQHSLDFFFCHLSFI